MKTKGLERILCIVLATALLLFGIGCAKTTDKGQHGGKTPDVQEQDDEGPEGGDYVEIDSLSESLAQTVNTTVTLTGDETFDLTGIEITGRKEVILNGFTLTLTGIFTVGDAVIFDVKPGEGTSGDAIDMSGLTFDVSDAPRELEAELSLIEIRPGVAFTEPEMGDGITLQEFPDILTVIAYFPPE